MTPSTRPKLPVTLAKAQHWVLAYRQLRDHDWSHDAIHAAIDADRLHPWYRGVYAVGRPELSREGEWMAAVLAAGPVAGLSHEPAGILHGLLERGDVRPHVTVPTHAGRDSRPGYTVHRSRILTPDDIQRVNGIPVLSVERTLWDLCGTTSSGRVRSAVRQGVRKNKVDLAVLRVSVEGRRDRRSVRLMRVVLLYVPREELTESELEARFLGLTVDAGFPPPDLQRRFGRRRADFTWHDCRLVVETDGRDHLTVVALNEDKAKDRALQLDGYAVIRFTWADIVNRPAQTIRELHQHRARRLRELGRLAGA